MGRLWQSVILSREYPVFTYLPFETLISATQQQYYEVLGESDRKSESTVFIEYMLEVIDQSLAELLSIGNRAMNQKDRLRYFHSMNITSFSRKDYMEVFKDISSATASRDLQQGVKMGLFEKTGDKRNTVYRYKSVK
jgi:Fic family protein